MALPVTDALPALFRTGDIGVSSEWRDMSYDWAHILTKDGVAIYTYLRDTFDHQRSLRPFILTPDGPTKIKLQHVLGYKTSWPMDGPEYLLQVAGLLHIEIGYGQSRDPERPQRTRVAYYTVGRLDHPVLDWHMLDRLLDALMIALNPQSTDSQIAKQQKKAQAAVRSLGQSGMLQDCDPDDLFYEYGAWPTLLPTLVCDERWITLFTYLHGAEAAQRYRRQARAWVEWVQRNQARLAEENRAIANQLLAAQRRGPRNGGESGPATPSIPETEAGVEPVTHGISDSPNDEILVAGDSVTGKAIGVTQAPCVTGESLMSHRAIGVTQAPCVTTATRPDGEPSNAKTNKPFSESLQPNQLTSRCWEEEQPLDNKMTPINNSTIVISDSLTSNSVSDSLPLVEPHLRDAELTSTRQDGYFWCAIQNIFYGTNERYSYTAGEKQAAHRRFKQQGIPVGVVLAALRTVMTLEPAERPTRFVDALKSEIFHACVQQALHLLPIRAQSASAANTWSTFLQAYRSVGLADQLRDVTTTDYHALYGLFSKQPDECWEVLSRVERAAHIPDLSPAYFRRAIANNQRAAAQSALATGEQPSCYRPGRAATTARSANASASSSGMDGRLALLEREGLKPQLLTEEMSEDYIRAWIDEADARSSKIRERAAWIAWGLSSGCLPADHPKLPPRESATTTVGVDAKTRGTQPQRPRRDVAKQLDHKLHVPSSSKDNGDLLLTNGEAQTWAAVLGDLQKRLPQSEFDTWIRETALVELVGTEVIIAAPHIFAREMLEHTYGSLITSSLHHVLGFPVQLQIVIC